MTDKTMITPGEQMSRTAELLRSLQDSVRRVRQQAEALCQNLQAGDETEVGTASKQIAAVEGLIRTCQKVEASLVEQYRSQAGIAKGGYALDLANARSEIGSRLDRLRESSDADEISE
ncbi:hypothetical protein [Arenibacterium halophilum]|jgi:hypothetical protein|uniref:PE family protein n=1 Tax=Arenibacterium halophilum TaxID=2583821 RepID=A0ABY2XD67_9RHOB|nr:hypothetical protein [Arenibacterium halophilum]MAY85612.1 hypothetical protein [Pseudooceanicola sp.]TMV14561.1 hypothetical protein FGK64_00800 [Arenibacterium halophilum]|tara:strand:+ start:510 stop:863 length:354 start_codon:yes stop_codon:yes gene_type:complete